MPGWLNIVVGVLAGLVVIAGAIYLAVRPYLKRDLMPGHKPWMPDATGRETLGSGGWWGGGEGQ